MPVWQTPLMHTREDEPVPQTVLLQVGQIRIDTEFGILSGPGGRCRLGGSAARLLPAMAARPGQIFTSSDILDLCPAKPTGRVRAEHVVRVRIALCRKVLRRVGGGDLLRMERGAGYTLQAPSGRRLNDQQAVLLDGLLASHPDQTAVGLFRMAEFSRSAPELAALRADQAANGIRLDSLGAA